MDGIVVLSFLKGGGKDRRKHLRPRAVLELRIQSRASGVGLILGNLGTVIIALFSGLLVQDIFRVVSSPRGKPGDF
jgi:hypothetical protein